MRVFCLLKTNNLAWQLLFFFQKREFILYSINYSVHYRFGRTTRKQRQNNIRFLNKLSSNEERQNGADTKKDTYNIICKRFLDKQKIWLASYQTKIEQKEGIQWNKNCLFSCLVCRLVNETVTIFCFLLLSFSSLRTIRMRK